MRSVSLFDTIVSAIRNQELSREEVSEIIGELRSAYAEEFQQEAIAGYAPTDFSERPLAEPLDSADSERRSPRPLSDDRPD